MTCAHVVNLTSVLLIAGRGWPAVWKMLEQTEPRKQGRAWVDRREAQGDLEAAGNVISLPGDGGLTHTCQNASHGVLGRVSLTGHKQAPTNLSSQVLRGAMQGRNQMLPGVGGEGGS